MSDTDYRIPYKAFIAAAARAFMVPVESITAPSRATRVVRARQAAALLIRTHRKDASMTEIGRRLGGRDHTTILHGVKQARRFIELNEGFRDCYRLAEQDALSWTPERSPTAVCTIPQPKPREERETPPAIKSDRPASHPAPTLRPPSHRVKDYRGETSREWCAANERRFRDAIARAHPERVPASAREAAE